MPSSALAENLLAQLARGSADALQLARALGVSLAIDYWTLLAGDTRLSKPFRTLCARRLEALRVLSVRGL